MGAASKAASRLFHAVTWYHCQKTHLILSNIKDSIQAPACRKLESPLEKIFISEKCRRQHPGSCTVHTTKYTCKVHMQSTYDKVRTTKYTLGEVHLAKYIQQSTYDKVHTTKHTCKAHMQSTYDKVHTTEYKCKLHTAKYKCKVHVQSTYDKVHVQSTYDKVHMQSTYDKVHTTKYTRKVYTWRGTLGKVHTTRYIRQSTFDKVHTAKYIQ